MPEPQPILNHDIQSLPGRRLWDRGQDGSLDILHQILDVALVVALLYPSEAVAEQIVAEARQAASLYDCDIKVSLGFITEGAISKEIHHYLNKSDAIRFIDSFIDISKTAILKGETLAILWD